METKVEDAEYATISGKPLDAQGRTLPAIVQQPRATPDDLIRTALAQDDVDLDRVERFYELKRRYEQDEARKAYVEAMAAFKAEKVDIVKDKVVAFSGTRYTHASIGNVVSVVCEALGRHGFSHRWDTNQVDGLITVTCVITHRLGHSESTALSGAPDDSGKKNKIQQTASTISYLQRYTLLAATGLATRDQEDDDGRGATGDAEDMVDDAERKIIADWIAAIEGESTIEGLRARKVEFTNKYEGQAKVPAPIKEAYNARLHVIAPPKTQP